MINLTGYRTLIVGAIIVLYAVASVAGVDVPAADNDKTLAISGFLMLLMRFLTNGPVGKAEKPIDLPPN